MKKRLSIFYYLLMVLAMAQPVSSQDKPNVILILTDQWRGQALGIAKEDSVFTPRLDEIAASGIWFSNAFAARPICGPNRACILTGQYPITNGVYGNSVRMSTASETLGTVAKANGYQTAYIGKWHLDGPDEGYVPPKRRSGFDYWIMSSGHQPFNQRYFIQDSESSVRKSGTWEPDWITDQAIEYIQAQQNDPFLMVLSFGPPHTGGGVGFEDRWQPGKRDANGNIPYGYGYAAPSDYEELYPDPEHYPRRPNVEPVGKYEDPSWPTIPGYFGAITSIDRNVGRLVDSLKNMNNFDNTIIFFTSDHGEMLGSQGRMTKGIWYQESVKVPAIVSYPGKISQTEMKYVFNSIDIFPTLCGLAGMDIPEAVQGTDFSPALKGNSMDLPEYLFTSFDAGSPTENDRSWRGVNTDRYTFVLAKKASYSTGDDIREEGMVLYDKFIDPYQMDPIYKGMGYDLVIDSLFAVLNAHLDRTSDPFIEDQWNSARTPYYSYDDALTRDMINDIVPPSKVTGLMVADTSFSSITLTWNPATDNVGVKEYEIYQATKYLQTTNDTFAIVTGLDPGTEYEFRVLAIDSSGNKSQIASVSATTKGVTGSGFNKGNAALNSSLDVFPNPAGEILYIRLPTRYTTARIRLMDSYGKQQLSNVISGDELELDISQLKMGLYIAEITLGNVIHRKKLLVN